MKNTLPRSIGAYVIVAPGGQVLMRVSSVSRLNDGVKKSLDRSETVFVKDHLGNALEVHRDGRITWVPIQTDSQPVWVGQVQKMLARKINQEGRR